jgi:hypothetical protein
VPFNLLLPQSVDDITFLVIWRMFNQRDLAKFLPMLRVSLAFLEESLFLRSLDDKRVD